MIMDMGNSPPLSGYESIEHPVLISIGDKDAMVTLEETIAVYRRLKNANLIVLPNTEHSIEKINFDRINKEIDVFLGIH